MAEFKISRFRYTWQGEWDTATATYNKDDVVLYQGKSWVCIRQHAPSTFGADQTYTPAGETNATPAWVKMTDGQKFLGDWTNNELYDAGVLVLAGGNVYLALATHTSAAQFATDILKWEVFAIGSNFRNTWAVSTRYRVGDVIRYNSYTYQCVLEHTSGIVSDGVIVGNADADADSTAETWKVVVENYAYVGEYVENTRYKLNDLVKYGGSILKCVTEHTSSANIVSANFEIYLSGFKFDNAWNSLSNYAVGDVVRYGGVVYVSNTNNSNNQPGANDFFEDSFTNVNWTVIHKGINFRGEYDPQENTQYQEGDVIRRGGALWVSLTNQFTDDSSLRPIDTTNWQLVVAAQNVRGTWRTNRDYNIYDVVYFRGVTYYATVPHNSSFENFPGDNGSGNDYWSILVIGDENNALTVQGDLLSFGLRRNILEDDSTQFTLGDGSTVGNISVPIGTEDQLLYVENNQGDLDYTTWGSIARIYYVRTTGIDDLDPSRGINYFKPYRTLKYALERADDGYQGTTSIKVSTGEYQEILPLIVPARTAILGEELRAVTIRANEPIAVYVADYEKFLLALVHIGTKLVNILLGLPASPSPGNVAVQYIPLDVGNNQSVIIDTLWGQLIDTIEFKIDSIGTPVVVTGTNSLTTDGGKLTAITILNNNSTFIKAEVAAYMANTHAAYVYDTAQWDRDVDRFIAALIYDLRYPGNYKTVLEGRYYANAVLGSAQEDMFYVRDTSGIRNMTLRGLEGTLPAVIEGDVYSIPTGGAFVSLDPGWGPADQRVWITNRSCYVQNVTTFGTAAVGQKVDGALHNSGNRSIVSNDFTQVISDGIGAWITNGGRAELVSVFSYYAHIGMFAQNGGIIRATNGNSSYGDFGAVADGIDTNETVRYGYLNTQTEQAVVAAAYAGEILDFIIGLEFSHCGQNYTTASYNITSSGAGALAIQEEFRDNSMFECQVLTGGTGFTQRGNQAQTGGTLTITLATAESATSAEILGMRLLITSGVGTGQYGYIQAYNSATKVCTIYRESDDLAGWDHVLPGTESAVLLTTGTRYRIEPRPIFSAPSFTATISTLATAGAWSAAAYGETSDTFVGLSGTLGTGTTVDVTPAAALFTVIKSGRTYTVTVSNGGAGYAVGNTITLDGANVGGITVEHDILLTVTDVSDDSTNSILAVSVDATNIADSGKFVLTPSSGTSARYSSDGETWTAFAMPIAGNWKCLAAGDNKFVAISNGSADAASSTNGVSWTLRSMPSSRNWSGVAYGKPSTTTQGVFVAVAENLNSAAYSTNGTTWTASTLPTFGDSTLNNYVDIAFGYNVFVALANSGNIAAVGTWTGTALTWQGTIMDVVADSSAKDWVSVAYGNRRFVAISSTGDVAYSFDGLVWLAATMPSQDGSTAHNWRQIRYGQGVFFAVGDTGGRTVGADPSVGASTYAATSYDGIVWTNRTMASDLEWGVVAFGNPDITLGDSTITNSRPTWIAAPVTSSFVVNKIYTGARALGRVVLGGVTIGSIKLWEPGSGYTSDPTLTITDPNKTTDATIRSRLADGVLAQPTFVNKGSAYKTSTTSITVTGDGFADKTPVGKFITLDGLSVMPGPGAQFYIGGNNVYRVAVIVGINEEILSNGTIRSTFQISPSSTLSQYLEHGMEVVIREKYSQVRITGHDFLDIGTGNFVETNYPVLYSDYDYSAAPEQEVQNLNGGRVFYTSTDQDGNFRAGEQFAVEQSTGIITISADFFDLAGLTELRLSGINVGSTAVIREFSKDPLFLQNSNNIIPTQRAVRSYLQSRLNIGGEDLLTPSVTAGTVKIGPTAIESTAGLTIQVPVMADFSGNGAGLGAGYIAQTLFYGSR